jgi:formyl-CoA transferase
VNAPYQALRTSDGYINIGAASQPTWEQFCWAIGREELIEDPRYKDGNDRKAREEELAEMLEGIMGEHTTEHWMEQLEAAGVVAGPIYDMEQVYSDEQVLAREMMVEIEDDELGTVKNIGVPVKLSATPGRIRHRGPALGEHSREVLLEHGYSEGEIEELVAAGIISA